MDELWLRLGYLSPSISHMSSAEMYVPPCAMHICVALFALGVPALHVLPEYVPPEAWHILDDLSRIVLEHAASGSASRATMAVVMSIFLEPIVASWLVDELPAALVQDPHGPDLFSGPVVILAAYLSPSG
jgi:hypothetical protein